MMQITASSDGYAKEKSVGKFSGHSWRNITTEEMYHIFGIIPKMCIDRSLLVGIVSYFHTS